MKRWELLGEARTPEGEGITLMRRDQEYVILAGGKPLMSSRMHGSEEALATFACRQARRRYESCVLVGGLGMAPGLCIGDGDVVRAQATHGSAPDIAGRGIANACCRRRLDRRRAVGGAGGATDDKAFTDRRHPARGSGGFPGVRRRRDLGGGLCRCQRV